MWFLCLDNWIRCQPRGDVDSNFLEMFDLVEINDDDIVAEVEALNYYLNVNMKQHSFREGHKARLCWWNVNLFVCSLPFALQHGLWLLVTYLAKNLFRQWASFSEISSSAKLCQTICMIHSMHCKRLGCKNQLECGSHHIVAHKLNI